MCFRSALCWQACLLAPFSFRPDKYNYWISIEQQTINQLNPPRSLRTILLLYVLKVGVISCIYCPTFHTKNTIISFLKVRFEFFDRKDNRHLRAGLPVRWKEAFVWLGLLFFLLTYIKHERLSFLSLFARLAKILDTKTAHFATWKRLRNLLHKLTLGESLSNEDYLKKAKCCTANSKA